MSAASIYNLNSGGPQGTPDGAKAATNDATSYYWQKRHITGDAQKMVEGRVEEILEKISTYRRPVRGKTHTNCPYPGHSDNNPSFRVIPDGELADKIVCSANCLHGDAHSIFDFIINLGLAADFTEAVVVAAEALGVPVTDPVKARSCTVAEFASHKHLTEEFLKSAGCSDSYYQTGKQSAVRFAYVDQHGIEHHPRFRLSVQGGKSSVMNEKGSRITALYGLDRHDDALEAGKCLLVEGESDTLTSHYRGYPCVGVPGALAYSDERAHGYFDDIPAVFVQHEKDEAADKLLAKLAGSSIAGKVFVFKLPDNIKDISQLHCEHPDQFDEILQAALAEAIPLSEAERAKAAETAPVINGQEVIPPKRNSMRTIAPDNEIGDIQVGAVDNWEQHLIRAANGAPESIQVNVAYALAASPELAGKLFFNEFSHVVTIKGELPWDKKIPPEGRGWDDNDQYCLISWCQANPMINANGAITKGAVHQVARMQRFDPLLEMIDKLTWDKIERLSTWGIRLLGAEDNEYVRAVCRKFIIAMVHRARHPGSQVDNVLILGGDEGIGKSRLLRALANPFFTDEISDLGTKDAAMQMAGIWLVEMSDLETLSRVEGVRANAFFSRSTDRFRPPYGMAVGWFPRRSLVCGTTNEDEVLQHATGLRRYWIIECTKAAVDGMVAERDQLLAEAAHYEAQGEHHWLEGDLVLTQRRVAKQHRVSDPWREVVAEYVASKTEWVQTEDGFSGKDILRGALDIDISKWTLALEMRAVRVLKDIGFKRRIHTTLGNRWGKGDK